jgi:isopenicillin-N epimerase
MAFVPKGYQGFGSFHSDNVEELIREEPHAPLPLPPRLQALREAAVERVRPLQFGAPLRAEFLLDFDWTFVNHGAFGAAARGAHAESRAWSEYAEEQPLRFIDRELFPHMCEAIRAVAVLVRAPPPCVSLVPNATYGLNSVISSQRARLGPGSTVFMLDIGYGSVKKMLARACEGTGASVVVGVIPFPLTGPEDVVSKVLAVLPPSPSLVVLDHVTSNTGLLLPIHDLVAAVRAARPRALILVDGAHGLGALDLDLPALGADYYVSNAHKWLCAPKGCGMLYAAPAHASSLRAASISHGSGAGFTSEFIWDGCREYGPALALPGLLSWWTALGGLHEAREYCRCLLAEAMALLTAAWGTGTQAPPSLYSHMACVQLPPACLPPGAAKRLEGGTEEWEYACTSTHGKMLQDALHYGCKTECPVKTLPGPRGDDNRSFVRISAAVYNVIGDYERLAAAVARIAWEEGGSLRLRAEEGQ